ncbi:MAG: glycosyltransferase [Brumimicrobium sp.]
MENKKSIGLIICNRNFGGQESRYLKIAYALFKTNWNVTVFINEDLYWKIKEKHLHIWDNDLFMERLMIVKMTRSSLIQSFLNLFFFHGFKIDPFLLNARKKILQTNPDIIVSDKDLINLKTLRKYFKNTIIKDYTSPESVTRSFAYKDYRYFDQVDHFYFVSPSVKTRFYKYFKNYLNNIIDSDTTIFETPFYAGSIEEVNFEEKTNTIIFAHQFKERKNPELFADIIMKFCEDKRYDSWKFGFYGRGPLESILKRKLKQHIDSGRVHFGFVYNLHEKLLQSKIFVSLIEPDNFPSQSIIEAMSTGNALLVLNSGESHRFIKENGILVEKDTDIILEKLMSLIDEDLMRLGQNSQALAKEKFAKEKYLEVWTKNMVE